MKPAPLPARNPMVLSSHVILDGAVVLTRFRSVILGEAVTTWFADVNSGNWAPEDSIAQGDRATVVSVLRKVRESMKADQPKR